MERDHCIGPHCTRRHDFPDGEGVLFMGALGPEDGATVTFLHKECQRDFESCAGCTGVSRAGWHPLADQIPADLFVHTDGCPMIEYWA